MSVDLDDRTDQYGIPRSEFEDVFKRLSAEAAKRVDERAVTSTTNYMYMMGIPQTPADLAMFAQTVAQGMLAAAVVDGWVTLTEKGTASEAEQADAAVTLNRAKARLRSHPSIGDNTPLVRGGYL